MASASGTKRKLDTDPLASIIPEAGDSEMKSTRSVVCVCGVCMCNFYPRFYCLNLYTSSVTVVYSCVF